MSHVKTDIKIFRLHTNETDIGRCFPHEFCSKEYIGESYMVYGQLGIQHRRDIIPIQDTNMTCFFPEVYCIDDQYFIADLKKRQKVKSHGTPVNEIDPRRKSILFFQQIDHMNADAFIGEEDVSYA